VRRHRDRLSESADAFRRVFENPGLRRLELAWTFAILAHWAYGVALAVYAYGKGGAAAVGLVGLIRFMPAALAAPLGGVLGDRYPRERVMIAANLGRALSLGGAAALIAVDGPAAAVYALAGLVSVLARGYNPAQRALLPALARTPEELTAANVTSSTVEAVGIFAGPALGGVVLAFSTPSVCFAVTGGAFLLSALLIVGIGGSAKAAETVHTAPPAGFLHTSLAGFRTIWANPDLRVIVGLYTMQTLLAGALNVFIVVVALRLLDLGDSGVGILTSALGGGGVAGAAVVFALVGSRRLAVHFGIAMVLWGLPLALIGVLPHTAAALLLLALIGVGNTVGDVAAVTLLQRAVPDDVLARVFGVLESLLVATMGLGAILAPVLIDGLGARIALVAAGALLPALVLLLWRRLLALDVAAPVPEHGLALLRAIPIFAPLPGPTLEHLARALQPLHAAAGTTIFEEGDHGDRFYVVESGRVEVRQEGVLANELGPGDFFGEIALLRDVPRTAGVAAVEATDLLSLERDEFIGAVTGFAASEEAADAVVGARLAGLPATV
jgi:predicted MFS family arabinose efflux permease